MLLKPLIRNEGLHSQMGEKIQFMCRLLILLISLENIK